MRLFVRAERSGDWKLHLYAVRQMLQYFRGAGHLNYATYVHIYLQQMSKLHNLLSPLLYQRFAVDGGFTVRRSEKYWCGIWSDITIEQVLMRTMRATGGLTYGCVMSNAIITCDSAYDCGQVAMESMKGMKFSDLMRYI